MHIQELLQAHRNEGGKSVPEWMLGAFERTNITFANGLSDRQTQVFWLQGRNLTIDLRLPTAIDLVKKPPADCSQEELLALADYEGWCAQSSWDGQQLSWSSGTSFQLHNRWPEPGWLRRVGDCMIEFAPSGAYVEEWRIRSQARGPLLSLEIIDEHEQDSGLLVSSGGGLIIAGNWAAQVTGRKRAIEGPRSLLEHLQDLLLEQADGEANIRDIFDFETSVATGSVDAGYSVRYSTNYQRLGEELVNLDGFEQGESSGELSQVLVRNGVAIKRRYKVDSLEKEFCFSRETPLTRAASNWYSQENSTLGRYLINQ